MKLGQTIKWTCPGCGFKYETDDSRPVCTNGICHYGAGQAKSTIPAFSIYALLEQGWAE